MLASTLSPTMLTFPDTLPRSSPLPAKLSSELTFGITAMENFRNFIPVDGCVQPLASTSSGSNSAYYSPPNITPLTFPRSLTNFENTDPVVSDKVIPAKSLSPPVGQPLHAGRHDRHRVVFKEAYSPPSIQAITLHEDISHTGDHLFMDCKLSVPFPLKDPPLGALPSLSTIYDTILTFAGNFGTRTNIHGNHCCHVWTFVHQVQGDKIFILFSQNEDHQKYLELIQGGLGPNSAATFLCQSSTFGMQATPKQVAELIQRFRSELGRAKITKGTYHIVHLKPGKTLYFLDKFPHCSFNLNWSVTVAGTIISLDPFHLCFFFFPLFSSLFSLFPLPFSLFSSCIFLRILNLPRSPPHLQTPPQWFTGN